VNRGDDLLARALSLGRLERVAGRPGVHLVGGAVRDLLLGGTPGDLDLVVEDGEAAQIAGALGEPVRRHERFGTASVEVGGRTYDVARARGERYARPGALPDVYPASLEEDLLRRDFAVNAWALALGPPAPGALRAAPGADEDLAARRLRVLHPGSFRDDPTRLLRLARYGGRLGFDIDPETERLARHAVEGDALTTVSGERIGSELALLARDPGALAGFGRLRELGIDEAIAPGFGLRDDLAERALALVPEDGSAAVVLLGAASRGVEDPAALLARLGWPADHVRAVLAARAAPDDLAGRPSSVVAERLRTPEQAALAGALGAEAEVRSWLDDLRHVSLAIDGHDLLAAGLAEGPEIGRILRELRALRLDGALDDDPAAQLAAARRISAR
jgi:tRNA nucleotidyltransferase (CCA-adding enzyme)